MRTSLGHERATAFLADEFKYRSTLDTVIDLVISQGFDTDPLDCSEFGTRIGRARHRRQQRAGPFRSA